MKISYNLLKLFSYIAILLLFASKGESIAQCPSYPLIIYSQEAMFYSDINDSLIYLTKTVEVKGQQVKKYQYHITRFKHARNKFGFNISGDRLTMYSPMTRTWTCPFYNVLYYFDHNIFDEKLPEQKFTIFPLKYTIYLSIGTNGFENSQEPYSESYFSFPQILETKDDTLYVASRSHRKGRVTIYRRPLPTCYETGYKDTTLNESCSKFYCEQEYPEYIGDKYILFERNKKLYVLDTEGNAYRLENEKMIKVNIDCKACFESDIIFVVNRDNENIYVINEDLFEDSMSYGEIISIANNLTRNF